MNETCRNCQHEVVANFCGNCGQKKHKRIDSKYIKDEMQYVLVHTNKGFFYTVKKLVKAPGTTALEFIEGSRVNHYKPILLAFLIAGISAFITNTFIHPMEVMAKADGIFKQKNSVDMSKFGDWIFHYQSIFMLILLPIIAFFSWISFRKWGRNYAENVVAVAFLYSALTVFSIFLILPIQFALRGNPTMFIIIPTLLSFALTIAITVWFYIQFYSEKNAGPVILRVLLMYGIMFGLYIGTIIVFTVYMLVTNPAAFKR